MAVETGLNLEFERTPAQIRNTCKAHPYLRIERPRWAYRDGWEQCQVCGVVRRAG